MEFFPADIETLKGSLFQLTTVFFSISPEMARFVAGVQLSQPPARQKIKRTPARPPRLL